MPNASIRAYVMSLDSGVGGRGVGGAGGAGSASAMVGSFFRTSPFGFFAVDSPPELELDPDDDSRPIDSTNWSTPEAGDENSFKGVPSLLIWPSLCKRARSPKFATHGMKVCCCARF